MTDLALSIGEPFASPAWGSNLAVFSSSSGKPVLEGDTKKYLAKVSKYARTYEVYLVPERFILQGSQCMCLIDPEGKVLGAQKAIFNNTQLGITEKGKEMGVIVTPFGGVFLGVDVDIYRPEVSKIAFNMGANIIVASQYFGEEQYSHHRVIAGVWSAAQDNNLFTVGVSNKYNAVCGPKAVTKYRDGFVASPTLRMPVTAKIEVDKDLRSLSPRPALKRGLYVEHRKELIGEPTD